MGDVVRLRELYGERRLAEAWAEYQGDATAKRAEWHLLGSLAASRQNLWFEARDAVERAVFLPAEKSLQARIQHQAGYVLRFIGEYGRAIDHFKVCLALIEELPDLRPLLLGPCHYNIALAMEHQRGKRREAVGHYTLARNAFIAEGMTDHLRMTLQNLAWVQCVLGNTQVAIEALDESDGLCTTTDHRHRQRLVWALVHARLGEFDQAIQICQSLQGTDVEPDVRSLSASIAADITLAAGRVADAEQIIKVAQSLVGQTSLDSRCTSVMRDVFSRIQAVRQATAGV